MRTTIDLPDDLMRLLKVRAALEGKKLKEIVIEALRKEVSPSTADQWGSVLEASPAYRPSAEVEPRRDQVDVANIRRARIDGMMPLVIKSVGPIRPVTGADLDELEIQEHLDKYGRPA